MRKIVCAIAFALVVAVSAFAQQRDYQTVEGKLVVKAGIPYVVGGRQEWVLPACPFYQLAWENQIREGDMISVDGLIIPCNDDDFPRNGQMIVPAAMWVNGREIELRGAKYFSIPQNMRRLEYHRRPARNDPPPAPREEPRRTRRLD